MALATTVITILTLNALILILLIAFNTEALRRVKNIIDILSNGAYSNCPFYRETMKNGRRKLDKIFENPHEGGEDA